MRSIKLNLRTREIESTDYAASENPPVLHRKETFLLTDDPRWSKFDRLTRQEERAGLLDEAATIGTRAGRADRLRERGYALRGHRLVRNRGGTRAEMLTTDQTADTDQESDRESGRV